jgi:hypothetical protein
MAADADFALCARGGGRRSISVMGVAPGSGVEL